MPDSNFALTCDSMIDLGFTWHYLSSANHRDLAMTTDFCRANLSSCLVVDPCHFRCIVLAFRKLLGRD